MYVFIAVIFGTLTDETIGVNPAILLCVEITAAITLGLIESATGVTNIVSAISVRVNLSVDIFIDAMVDMLAAKTAGVLLCIRVGIFLSVDLNMLATMAVLMLILSILSEE